MDAAIVLTTIDEEHADAFCEMLLKQELAACIERFPVTSMYMWQGKLCDERELSLIIKTVPETLTMLTNVIENTHPYDSARKSSSLTLPSQMAHTTAL